MIVKARPTSVILCGGKAVRFGRDKAAACVGGATLMERIVRVVGPLSEEIIVVTSADRADKDISMGGGVKVVSDVYPGRGPLGGIYTGLLHAQSDLILAIGCDMPFLSAGVINYMFGLVNGFDVVAPRLDGTYIEPLHTFYTKKCLMNMKTQLENGQLSIWPVIRGLNTRYIEMNEYLPLDPCLLSLFNINTPEEYERANRIASQVEL